MASDDEIAPSGKREFNEGELIRYKKEKRKLRHEKLVKSLEKKRKKEDLETEYEERRKKEIEKGQIDRGRDYTVSLALPGSILDNAQSPELRTYLAGQIARALAVFSIDEVIVFDDVIKISPVKIDKKSTVGEFSGIGKHGEGCLQLARILQFLECPQYLRKHFFPIHKDLQYAGVLNPTDMPHHLRANEWCQYREGVVLDKPPTKYGSMVNIGLPKDCCIDKKLTPGVRVTAKLSDETSESKMIRCQVVAPSEPREKKGLYWGYSVRLADSLSSVFSQSPFKGGYDLTIGTSERGSDVDECTLKSKFSHLLIVFGGLKGLEAAVEADDKLAEVEDPSELFDLYLNTCVNQGSRTIRTEEAILISLSAVRPKILKARENI